MLVQHDAFEGWIAIDQIRTIDKQRIIKLMGELHPKEVQQLKSIIQETFVD
jgi:mRNA interferase MazF